MRVVLDLYSNPQWNGGEALAREALAGFVFPAGTDGEISEVLGESSAAEYYRGLLAEGFIRTYEDFMIRVVGGMGRFVFVRRDERHRRARAARARARRRLS